MTVSAPPDAKGLSFHAHWMLLCIVVITIQMELTSSLSRMLTSISGTKQMTKATNTISIMLVSLLSSCRTDDGLRLMLWTEHDAGMLRIRRKADKLNMYKRAYCMAFLFILQRLSPPISC